jgi:predicted RNA-binding Zn-ribbon protein involved in translation (DUF1610 family)
MYDNLYARPDMLVPSGDDGWELIEVKSCMMVHESHVRYTGFIYYVCSNCGIRINRCHICHLRGWVEDTTPADRIFEKTDVTERVLLMQDQIRGEIASMRDIVRKHRERRQQQQQQQPAEGDAQNGKR